MENPQPEHQSRIEKEIAQNTISFLLKKFDDLLLGLDTRELRFKNKEEENRLTSSIKNYTSYRLREKIIKDKSLWNLLEEINTSIITKKSAKTFLKKLYESSKYPNTPHLSSIYSRYLRIKSKESNQKKRNRKGESVIRPFFTLLDKKLDIMRQK